MDRAKQFDTSTKIYADFQMPQISTAEIKNSLFPS